MGILNILAAPFTFPLAAAKEELKKIIDEILQGEKPDFVVKVSGQVQKYEPTKTIEKTKAKEVEVVKEEPKIENKKDKEIELGV